jgi:predicted RNA-binding protein
MCQSSIWLKHPDGQTEKIADDILIVRQEGPYVLFGRWLAEPMQITGTIREIDAMKHTITLIGATAGQKAVPAPGWTVAPAHDTADSHAHHVHPHNHEHDYNHDW